MQISKLRTYRSYIVITGVFTLAVSLGSGTAIMILNKQHSGTMDITPTAAHVQSEAFIKPVSVASPDGTTAGNAGAPSSDKNNAPVSTAQLASSNVPNVPAKQSTGLGGTHLYIDPANHAAQYAAANTGSDGASLIARIGQQPVAQWFGGWNGTIQADVSAYVSAAANAGAVPVLVAYNIPNRDCGGFSAGGAQTEAAYAVWIRQFSAGIGNRPAIVVLEPDAIALQTCLNGDQLAARNRELVDAVTVLRGNIQTHIYLDAGHSNWVGASDMATRLKAAGVAGTDGFALNVSNFESTANNVAYGTQLSALTGGKHFVIDTSRNGNGTQAGQWCNPAGAALGTAPTTQTGNSLVDAYVWVKTPWESDGSCNGAPDAGSDYWVYAVSLARAAGW